MSAEPTIFIVDDHHALRDSLVELLESVGWRAETFAAARAFLDAYTPDRPGCLLLDVRIPGMSGLELQDQLKRRGITIPIIFITSHGDVPMAVRALKGGAVDFLEKPFNDQVLLECIQQALKKDADLRRQQARLAPLRERFLTLTPREREVMQLLVSGTTNKTAAAQLGISRKTLDIHRAKILEKMQAESLVELARLVMQVDQTQLAGPGDNPSTAHSGPLDSGS